MKKHSSFFKFFLGACLLGSGAACYDVDDFYTNPSVPETDDTVYFDYSTTQQVDLVIDYSDFNIHGPVLFRVYSENPIINENNYNEYVDERIEPILEAYTDERGIFDATVTLPAYAKVLHIVTGNFMIGLKRSLVEVVAGEARLKLAGEQPTKAAAPCATGPGESTCDVSAIPALSFNYKKDGTLGDRVYKDWFTPLGTWNSASGRPDYIADQQMLSPELRFSDELINGLYTTACKALNSGTTCKEEYRSAADLTISRDSEVSLAALGSMTCWNSSFGYYYYTASQQPESTEDLNVIMLFPNTQDGYRYTPILGSQYQGNIGMQRGDVIQLLYYPNIADGDVSTVSTVFPKGTRIGFVLKPNAWGSQGNAYCTKNGSNVMNKKMNIWSASTDGLSYCNQDLGSYKLANLTGEARTAKFSYISPNGTQYAIVSIEDACDDADYDDLLFALNPADVFTELPQVAEGKTTKRGVYAFEDRWPRQADYDMNDVMVECIQEQYFQSGNVKQQVFSLTTYQNVVADISGLALRLVTKAKPSSIVMKKKAPGEAEAVTTSYSFDGEAYYLTSDITATLGTTYIFEITYSSAQNLSKLATIQPFLYRDYEDGQRWEVHIPYESPTSHMDPRFFRDGDDASDTNAGRFYVNKGEYPFAFYLDNAKIDYFLDNILKHENEGKPIDRFFPEFGAWSTSRGKKNADWYLHPIR
ncbi:MAG: LruC domain-containing protein [Bacteroidales bacterium]|nr:LruC domain-containing protein [Bacteroidales bacterium]